MMTSNTELSLEAAGLIGHPAATWATTIPEYLDIISRTGLEPALPVIGMVEKAKTMAPIRIEVMTLPEDGQPEPWPEREAAALEITICIAVQECERGRIEKQLETSTRVETRGRGTASISCAGRILAASDRPQTPLHKMMIHDGERLREIYGPARIEKLIQRIIQQKNKHGGTRPTNRRGTQLVRR